MTERIERFRSTYLKHIDDLEHAQGTARAMELAVGGHFAALGTLELALLRQHGLQPHHDVVDVGCGSGRLAIKLRDVQTGGYLGIDVVPKLVDYARDTVQRPDWRFEVAQGLVIPAADASADFVVFFSVLTHLNQEEAFRYVAQAARVLRPGGKLVFSFLEFAIGAHWFIFDGVLKDPNPDKVLNHFMDRDQIRAFAARLGLTVQHLIDGDQPHIPLTEPVVYDDGTRVEGLGLLGQSVAVLVRDGGPARPADVQVPVHSLSVQSRSPLVLQAQLSAVAVPTPVYLCIERDGQLLNVSADGSLTHVVGTSASPAPWAWHGPGTDGALRIEVPSAIDVTRASAAYVGLGPDLANVVQQILYARVALG
jgi:SAM-dependent methyltransferase